MLKQLNFWLGNYHWRQLGFAPFLALVLIGASCWLWSVLVFPPTQLSSPYLEDQALGTTNYFATPPPPDQIKKIAILAAHTLKRNDAGAIIMIDGGSWNPYSRTHSATVTEVLAAYPERVYSEYRYSRELSALVAQNLREAGFSVRIFDPDNPDRNGFIRQSLAEAAVWGADLVLTLHTDGSEQQNLRGAFAIVDDRYPVSETTALALERILAGIQTEVGIPLAQHHPSGQTRVPERLRAYTAAGGLLNTTEVGLNRLGQNFKFSSYILYGQSLPAALRAQIHNLPVIYLEVGTHSHALDRQLLLTKQKELAAAISRGVSETYQARSPFNPNRALLAYTSVAVWQQPIAALTPIAWPQVKTTTLVDFVLGQEAELERSWLTALVTALSQEAAAADLAPTLLLAELLLNNNFYRLSNFSDLPAPLPRVPASLQGQKLYASALLAGGSHWRADLTDYVQQWQALLQPLASSFYQTTTVCPLNYFALAQNQRAQTQVSLKALAAAYPETTAHLQALSQLQSQIYYFALSQ